MRVECVSNRAADLPSRLLARGGYGGHRDTVFDLDIGGTFVVYSMYLDDDGFLMYDLGKASEPWCADLFRVTDGRLPRHWVLGQETFAGSELVERSNRWIWGVPDLLDSDFYLRLIEGDWQAVATYERYKDMMNLEFPDPDNADVATLIEGDWILCPNCADGWEACRLDAMARCPACKAVVHNPCYSG